MTRFAGCAIMVTEREREGTKMLNWYENPELHEEDYAELMALLAEEEGE